MTKTGILATCYHTTQEIVTLQPYLLRVRGNKIIRQARLMSIYRKTKVDVYDAYTQLIIFKNTN